MNDAVGIKLEKNCCLISDFHNIMFYLQILVDLEMNMYSVAALSLNAQSYFNYRVKPTELLQPTLLMPSLLDHIVYLLYI
jgi:hypothetical protein